MGFGKKETYCVTITCDNCDGDNEIYIPKGVTKEEFLKEDKICEDCGCNL